MDGASGFSEADDNSFSSAFADFYLQNPVNLEQVNPAVLQDHDLNNINEQYPTIEPQSFLELVGPAPIAPAAIDNNDKKEDDTELSPDKIDEIESNQFAPKTKKQTTWGVKKFKGNLFRLCKELKVKNKVVW